MRIEVNHLSRVEGHAHLVVDTRRGELRDCRLEVVESPRFFESLLRGRHFSDVAPIAARICGVCSNSHTLVSLAATEAALGVGISEQTRKLRRLLACGEVLQSHLLHLYFMVVPDFMGVASIFPLAKSHRELVGRALRMKKLANDICQLVGGRPVHPVTPCVGGFSALPEPASLQDLRRRLVAVFPDLEATVELFGSFEIPEFHRASEWLSLDGDGRYPVVSGQIVSSRGYTRPVAEYREVVEEYLVSHSTAKFARTQHGAYRVGPQARVRNAFPGLSPMARKVAAAVGLAPESENPFFNVVARLVEVVHCIEESISLIDVLLADGLAPESPAAVSGGGGGAAAIEAPRGILFHAYEYDDAGCVLSADCVIPTAQNLASIEADLAAWVPRVVEDRPQEEVTRSLELLVRSYDPCISCSTHLVRVEYR